MISPRQRLTARWKTNQLAFLAFFITLILLVATCNILPLSGTSPAPKTPLITRNALVSSEDLPALFDFGSVDPPVNKKPGKVVIVLAVNEDGGVTRWKTPEEWSIERSSIANKRSYAKRHGYTVSIRDLTTKKRYSHEWRQAWERVDALRAAMRENPDAEWFWWLDLHTLIMEPQVSLEELFLNHIEKYTYRDVDRVNPKKIPHRVRYTDIAAPVDLILAQDCGGFNLGSFFLRRTAWAERLLDVWWDPVVYEQKHMEWEHQEQDALEHLYANHGWVRSRTAFLPLRMINALPPGACKDRDGDPALFYRAEDRDFLVNMAGCQWGRNCFEEMEKYKQLSKEILGGGWTSKWGKGVIKG